MENINLKDISDVKLREDGNEAQLTFIGKDEQSLTVTLSFEQVQLLEDHILKLAYAGRVNRGLHSDTPKNFAPLREVYLVDGLQLEMAPTGHLTFLIESNDNRAAQVTLTPQHSQMLRQILGGKGQKFQMG